MWKDDGSFSFRAGKEVGIYSEFVVFLFYKSLIFTAYNPSFLMTTKYYQHFQISLLCYLPETPTSGPLLFFF